MTVDISNELNTIKSTQLGRTMRPALHDAIHKQNKELNRSSALIDEFIKNAQQVTPQNAEIVAARIDNNSNMPITYATLGKRLDRMKEDSENKVATLNKNLEQTNAQLSHDKKELLNKIQEVASTGTTTEVLRSTTESYIQEKIDDGTIANLTIEDDSITSQKYKSKSIMPSHLSEIDETLQEDLFHKKTIQGEYVGQTSGDIIINPSYEHGRSDYMSVEESKLYEFLGYTSTATLLGAFFDINYRFVSYATLISTEKDNIYRAFAPKGSRYFVLNYSKSLLNETYFKQVGNDSYSFRWLNVNRDNLDDSVEKFIHDIISSREIPLEQINGSIQERWINQNLNVKIGYYVNPTSGAETAYGSEINGVSDFIEVEENQKVKYVGYTALKNYNGCIYDVNKNKIGNLDSPTVGGEIIEMTMPKNAKYVRLNLSDEVFEKTFLSIYVKIKNKLQSLELVNSNIPNQFITKEMLSDEVELEIKDGSIGLNKLSEDTIKELKYTEILDSSVTVKALAQDVIDFIQNPSSEPINPFANLKTTWIGDSITAGVGSTSTDKRYSNRVVKALSMSPSGYQNLGVSGSSISNTTDSNWTIKSFVTRICVEGQIKNGQDIIFILGGVNDLALNIPISTMSEQLEYYKTNGSWNDYTFYGALNRLISYIRENHSNSELIYITPIHYEAEDTRHSGNRLKYYVEAIREVCEYYAVPIIDLYKDLPLDPKNPHHKSKYTMNGSLTSPDGCHPSDLGNELMAKKIINYLKYQYIM